MTPPPSVSIFIKSHPPDYVWLDFCLRSLIKYATGFSEVVVALPEGHSLPLTREKVVLIKEWNDPVKPGAPSSGYFQQMCAKVYADDYTGSDLILYIDSDCVLTRPFDVSEMFRDGKPLLLRRRWEESGTGVCWKEPAQQALGPGMPVEFDTMCCHPSIYRRDTLSDLRDHMRKVHGVSAEEYIRSAPKFIEFVSIGNFILNTRPEQYAIMDCGANDEYPRPFIQNWSWGGLTPEIKEELDRVVEVIG